MKKIILLFALAIANLTAFTQKYWGDIEAGIEFGKDNTGAPEKSLVINGSGIYSPIYLFWNVDVKHSFHQTGSYINERYKMVEIGPGNTWDLNESKFAGGVAFAVMQMPIFGSTPKKSDFYYGAGLQMRFFNPRWKIVGGGSYLGFPRNDNNEWKKNILVYYLEGTVYIKWFGITVRYKNWGSTQNEPKVQGVQYNNQKLVAMNSKLEFIASGKIKFDKDGKYAVTIFAGPVIESWKNAYGNPNLNVSTQNNFIREKMPVKINVGLIFGFENLE